MHTIQTNSHTFFPTVLFMLAAIAAPVVFVAIARLSIEGELLTMLH